MDDRLSKYLSLVGIFACLLAVPQWADAQALWTDVDVPVDAAFVPSQSRAKAVKLPDTRFSHVRRVQADSVMLRSVLEKAPMERTQSQQEQIQLPMPDGSIASFYIAESPVMAYELARKYPEIKTYKVRSVNDASITGRLDMGPQGFHAYVTTPEGVVYIDPDSSATTAQYNSFYKKDYISSEAHKFSCGVKAETVSASPVAEFIPSARKLSPSVARVSTGNELLTYDIAVATTGEYSVAVAGNNNPAGTLAAVVTAINRVNGIFERDLAMRLQLIPNNNLLMFTNSSLDGYTNSDAELLATENQSKIDGLIGSGGYDIGHVFSTGGGGLASLGSVCENGFKAHGTSGLPNPVGDPFYIDFIAHEIGHQFAATHSFNGSTGQCGGGNRHAATAFEPGSGTTIMAYAGICDAENIASISDDMFHAGNIEQIVDFTRTGSGNICATASATANPAPTVINAGLDYTIPALTPFTLLGSATGASSYQWDEMDVGVGTNAAVLGTDRISNPLFRSFPPNGNSSRTFPQLSKVLAGSFGDIGETLPEQNRELNFRFTAREGSGGVSDDDVKLTVDGFSGPFVVMQPNVFAILNKNNDHVIEWNAACTDLAPVSCNSVDILFSSDGGVNFSPIPGASGLLNKDGQATVSLASFADTNTARIKVACSGNIFFDISNADFSLAATGQTLMSTGAGGSSSCNVPPEIPSLGADIEPNDSPAQAQAITLPFSIIGSINDSVDLDDYYVFTSSGGAHTIIVSNYGANDLDLYLYDSTGVNLIQKSESQFGFSETISIGLANGQTYYVVVNGFDTLGLEVNYSLSVTKGLPLTGSGGGGSLSRLLLGFVVTLLLLRVFRRT